MMALIKKKIILNGSFRSRQIRTEADTKEAVCFYAPCSPQ